MDVEVAIGLGSNLGDSERHLLSALIRLGEVVKIANVAPLFRSPPFDGTEQPLFYNTALVGTTALAADQLLAVCKRLEWLAGRRRQRRWGPRPLDVDLLVYGSLTLAEPELTLPHPGLAERLFVLEPLARVAPTLTVPPGGETVSELRSRLAPGDKLEEIGWSLRPEAPAGLPDDPA